MSVTQRLARGRFRKVAALLAAPVIAASVTTALAAPAAHADEPAVGSATLHEIQVTGAPAERFSLVVMGDGYTAAEQDKFLAQVEEHMNVMWSIEPYKSYRNYFNVYAVSIVSGVSGVSCDNQLTDPVKSTPLSMSFWGGCKANSVQRLITMSNTAAQNYARLAPKVDQVLALANSDTYGGAGGAYATASGGNALSALISPHEIGHSLGGLQDEYDYYTRGITTGNYTGREPSSAHHTLMTTEQMAQQQVKWWRWLGEESESGGIIDRYEGGLYYSTGVWRPSKHSMMKTLGYYMDQVSREIMTEKISSKLELVPRSTPTDAPVAADQVLWVETAHPVYHELDVTWAVNGTPVAGTNNSRNLDLAGRGLVPGDVVTATVVDNTEFVRDPALRNKPSMTQVRTWTVGTGTAGADPVAPAITAGSPTDRSASSEDVLYVETSHPAGQVLDVAWDVDGAAVPNPFNSRNLDLGSLDLSAGTHTVTATVTDPTDADAPAASMSWVVDAEGPTVGLEITGAIGATTNAAGEPHYTAVGSFGMKLTPADNQAGYVVGEFRLDGDGWHNYYGWPTDKDAPFLFTPTGTNVDDLVYGNLGSNGMSLSPFTPRTPGYGLHRVEYRAIDAAGNIGEVKAFTVHVLPESEGDGRAVITADVTGAPLTMSTSSSGPITLPGLELTGLDQVTSGELPPVDVVDPRGTQAGWALSGQVTDFISATSTILADNLGWRPAASLVSGDLPVPVDQAPSVAAGAVTHPGSGLGSPQTLCSAPAGHSAGSFSCSAGLDLGIPGSSTAGTFTGLLTLTLI